MSRVAAMLATLLMPVLAPACLAAGATDATRALRSYTEVTTSDFVLVTSERELPARKLAAQIVLFRRALESLFGAPLRSSLPATIFALEGTDWTRYAQPRAGMEGYFAAQPFAVDLMFDASRPGRQSLELTLHEYTHHLLRTMGPSRAPPFVDEGLAEVLSSARFGTRVIRFGVREDHLALLRRSAWLPFERFVDVRQRDPHYLDYAQARLFYAQAWATMFYALSSETSALRRLPAYLEALRAGDPAAVQLTEPTAPAAETLVGVPAARANDAIASFVLGRAAPAELVIRVPPGADAPALAVRRIGADEYDVRLGELLLRLGNRATLARSLLRSVPEDSSFAARGRVGAALAVLQSGDLQFAAALLDDPAVAQGLDAATEVQLARGLLRLSLPAAEGEPLPEPLLALRQERLQRARVLFAAALQAPCCWLEATQGYVVSMLALQLPDPALLAQAQRAYVAAPSNPELAAAMALVHEAQGSPTQARAFWAAAARNLPQGPARARMLQRMASGPTVDAAAAVDAAPGRER